MSQQLTITIPLASYIDALIGSKQYAVITDTQKTQIAEIDPQASLAVIERGTESRDWTGALLPELTTPGLWRLWRRADWQEIKACEARRIAQENTTRQYRAACVELLAAQMSLATKGMIPASVIVKTLEGKLTKEIEASLVVQGIGLPVKGN